MYGFFTAIFQTNVLQRQTRTANKQFLLALEKHAPNPQKELLPAKKSYHIVIMHFHKDLTLLDPTYIVSA